jgi:sigma-54 specific flagellar transcriptional regulator A
MEELPARYRAHIPPGSKPAPLPAGAPAITAEPVAAGTASPANGEGSGLPEDGLDLREHMARIELQLIREALERSQGVVAHAAQLLGLRRTTLVEKLRKYGIDREQAELVG